MNYPFPFTGALAQAEIPFSQVRHLPEGGGKGLEGNCLNFKISSFGDGDGTVLRKGENRGPGRGFQAQTPMTSGSTTHPSCTCLLLDSRREFGRPEILSLDSEIGGSLELSGHEPQLSPGLHSRASAPRPSWQRPQGSDLGRGTLGVLRALPYGEPWGLLPPPPPQC